tara:strand:+ start:221 stop:1558 length:1338 start_codon:yes stop_codon:yes gene_type:complete
MKQGKYSKIEFESKSFSRNRRLKSFIFLSSCFIFAIYPHFFEEKVYFPFILFISIVVAVYGLLVISKNKINSYFDFQNANEIKRKDLPYLDILVAARDEQNVISGLVERLFNLDYPNEKLNIYIIDDGSSDNTPIILEELSKKFDRLNIIRRLKDAGGGKSGALNYALKFVSGDWLLILDADAQLQNDTLQKLFQFAFKDSWSIVQLRKSVVNISKNFLTNCQSIEMVMDSVFQYGRLFQAGVSELRGNGQLIKKDVLLECGAFNENTVTDDLDLSLRLLLSGANIGILINPPVMEEGVETISALFAQRQRWAEGGLQRFFDYWQSLLFGDIKFAKKFDIIYFFILQYALPIITLLDLLVSIILVKKPLYWPISFTAFMLSGIASWYGCNRKIEGPVSPKLSFSYLIVYFAYLSHWFLVIPWVTLKMSCLPKKIHWKKTMHKGIN